MIFSDSTELLMNAQESGLYPKLVAQLKKDFVLANITIQLGADIGPPDLENILLEKLYQLMMERFSEYLNLLYIVDVPEKAFKNIQVTDVVEVARQVTFLVLRRELQKVRLKNTYS